MYSSCIYAILNTNKEKKVSETKKLPTIDIKGKEYVQVKDRIIELHRQNDSFSLSTDIIYDDDNKGGSKSWP